MSSAALAVNSQPDISGAFAGTLALIGYFEPNPTLAVAVSGGSDSMALLLLLHNWAKNCSGTVVALTVDHGLRSESSEEAAWVKEECDRLSITHHTLAYQGEKPLSAIQETARDIRYSLLTSWCKANHVLHLFTAHHQGDQAETVVFRAARGSGLSGLSGMAVVSISDDVRLIRPLLGFSKNELMQYLAVHRQDWIEDSTNQNLAYSRTRIRRIIRRSGLTERITRLSLSFETIRNRLKSKEASYSAQCVSIDPAGFAVLQLAPFLDTPPVLAQSLLSSVLQTISGNTEPPRRQTIERLYEDMTRTPAFSRQNVAGCWLQYRNRDAVYFILREPAAMAPSITLKEGVVEYWDNRFLVSYQAEGKLPGLTVGPLGEKLSQMEGDLPYPYKDIPGPVLKTFPAFTLLEEVVLVPHINWQHAKYAFLAGSARFKPRKPLAGALFWGTNSIHKMMES